MREERRKHKRIALRGDYLVSRSEPGKHFEYIILNISSTGACIQTTASLDKDHVIDLHFEGPREVSLKSKVVWKSGSNYGLLFFLETGMDFDSISYVINNAVYLSERSPG
jgi:hypothetical protein